MMVGLTRGAVMAAVLATSLISAGCESTSFIPPPPPAPGEPAGTARAVDGPPNKGAAGGKRVVELILARPPDADRIYLEQMLRHELAKGLIPLRLDQPGSDRPASPDELAGAIRAAVGRGVAGLIVEAVDAPAVADALHDADARGVAVLVLDRPVPARGGRPIPRVEYTGFDDVGRRIVQALLDEDRRLARPKPGRIVFLHHRSDDPYLERAVASLLGPCEAAGRPVQRLEFEGDVDRGIAVLRKALEADPDVDIVLADAAMGVYAGFRVHVAWTEEGHRKFLLAGYSPNDYRIVTFLERIQALGDRSVVAYASKASRAIRDLMDGQPAGERIEVPVAFIERPKTPIPTAKETLAPPRGRQP